MTNSNDDTAAVSRDTTMVPDSKDTSNSSVHVKRIVVHGHANAKKTRVTYGARAVGGSSGVKRAKSYDELMRSDELMRLDAPGAAHGAFSFSGRARRSEYWKMFVIQWLLFGVAFFHCLPFRNILTNYLFLD